MADLVTLAMVVLMSGGLVASLGSVVLVAVRECRTCEQQRRSHGNGSILEFHV